MCGLAGIVDLDGAPIARSELSAMGASLCHRGPDAEGIFVDESAAPSVGFVHRRLAIIDLSRRADQPLASEDGAVRAMLNGEIYNFAQLRAALQARHVFASQGDTESVVHGYEEHGDAIFARLDGMFALALWDARRRRVLLARDPFGKKPLYVARSANGRRLFFGSEIKALLAAGVPVAAAAENLGEYLAFGYVPSPRTFFRGIEKLPPSSFTAIDAHGIEAPQRYWELRFPAQGEAAAMSEQEAIERTDALLVAAVRKRLVADVPLGILLSGGIDSSGVAAIAAAAARASGGPAVRTFCVGFEDATFDERPYAAAVAQHIGADHHAELVKPDAAALIETLIAHHDEPFGDSSALPTYLVAQVARRHVTVALNGDGGDEAFAGYDRFYAALLAERLPAPAIALADRTLRLFGSGQLPNRHPLRQAQRFAAKASRPFLERYFAWSTFNDVADVAQLAGAATADPQRLLSSWRETLATLDAAQPRASVLSRLLYLNARTYLLDDLLPKMDRMTMAHGLEARSPFLDRDLFAFAASLPDRFKRSGREGKVVLRKALVDRLPPGILRRPKQGFGVPLGRWFREDLRELAHDTLLDRPRYRGLIPVDNVRRVLASHETRERDNGHALWILLTLELWLRRHGLSF